MKLVKIPAIVVSGFCLGPGKGDVFKGQRIELDPYTYGVELQRGRVKPVPVDNSAVTAEALAQARTELIAKIAQAQTVEDLEQLLSEDPEIVAAYEKRLEELGSAADQPIEEQPVEESAEEQLVEESAAEQSVEEQPVEEQPVEEQPVEEQPVEKQPVEKQPVEKQPALPASGKAKK